MCTAEQQAISRIATPCYTYVTLYTLWLPWLSLISLSANTAEKYVNKKLYPIGKEIATPEVSDFQRCVRIWAHKYPSIIPWDRI